MGMSKEELMDYLDIDHITAKLLKQRGIDTEDRLDEMLNRDLNDLSDPNTIPGVYDLIELIKEHEDGTITIFGDFDVDGTTSSVILYKGLKKYKPDMDLHILPGDRYRDGYSLSRESIDLMDEIGTDLIITVDCGISSHKEIGYAQLLGMDVGIIDHHESDEPPNVPYVDLKVTQGNYSEQEYSAAGITWRFCQALLGDMFTEVLDFVTLSTIADIVPLTGENRIIVREGLNGIRKGNCHDSIKALMDRYNIKPEDLVVNDIAFFIGPAINAAGRIGSPKIVIDLFTCKDTNKCYRLANRLYQKNEQRKETTKDILKNIQSRVTDSKVIVEKGEMKRGYVGLVAGKIQDQYQKPTIIVDPESGKGSARSMEPFHIYENLKKCVNEGIVKNAGGHKMAAGMAIDPENVPLLRDRLSELAEGIEYKVEKEDFVVDIDDINQNVVDNLNKFAPYGHKFHYPRFKATVRPVDSRLLYSGDHITFYANGIRCIAFYQADKYDLFTEDTIDIIFEPTYDTYNEAGGIQLIVREIEKTS